MSDSLPPAMPPAGWYPDPRDPAGERWWSGAGWTEHVRVVQLTPPPAPEPLVAPAAPFGHAETESTGNAGASGFGAAGSTAGVGWSPSAPSYPQSSQTPEAPRSKRQAKAAEYRAARSRNFYGYLGCVLGLVAFIVNFFGVPSILAIIFGSIGIATSRRLGGGKGTGAGWSITGLILGLLGLAFFAWNLYRVHATGLL